MIGAASKVFLVFMLACSSGSAQQARTLLVNGTAAIINKKVVTVQDAFVFRAIQRVKSGQEPIILEEEGDNLKKTVQKIVFEEMVLAEMKSLQKGVNVQNEFSKWFKEGKEHKKGLQIIKQRYGVSDADLAQKVTQTLTADRFVQMKIETVTPVITEDEAQKYFKRNEAQFRGRSYENLKPNIVVLLKKQAVQKSLEEWVRSLKEKYEVTMLLEG